MSQKEFLEELRTALSGKLSAQAVLENIEVPLCALPDDALHSL